MNITQKLNDLKENKIFKLPPVLTSASEAIIKIKDKRTKRISHFCNTKDLDSFIKEIKTINNRQIGIKN